MGKKALAERCLDACNGDGWAALSLAVRLKRFELLAAGLLDPDPDEPLPLPVRAARAAARVG